MGEGVFVISIFLSVIAICIFMIFAPLYFMDRSEIRRKISSMKKDYYVFKYNIEENAEEIGVEVDIKKINFNIGYFNINKKYSKIQDQMGMYKLISSNLHYIKTFNSILEKNFDKLNKIEDSIVTKVKDNRLANKKLIIKRKMNTDVNKLPRKDTILNKYNYIINSDNIKEIYEDFQGSNAHSYDLKVKYKKVIEKLTAFSDLLREMDTFYVKIRIGKAPNKNDFYSRLNKLLVGVGNKHITIFNLKKVYDEFKLKCDDFKNTFFINQEVSILYSRRGALVDQFTQNIKQINIHISKIMSFKGVLEKYKPFDTKIKYKYYIENMIKLVDNSYDSIQKGNYKHADITRKRCGMIVKDLDNKLKEIQKLYRLALKSKEYYFEYGHELKTIPSSLFSKIKIKINKYVLNDSITSSFKSVWDSILELNENKKDIVTLSKDVKTIYTKLIVIDEEIEKIPNKKMLPVYGLVKREEPKYPQINENTD